MAFQPQQTLHGNRYIIHKRIGKGGFGITSPVKVTKDIGQEASELRSGDAFGQ